MLNFFTKFRHTMQVIIFVRLATSYLLCGLLEKYTSLECRSITTNDKAVIFDNSLQRSLFFEVIDLSFNLKI